MQARDELAGRVMVGGLLLRQVVATVAAALLAALLLVGSASAVERVESNRQFDPVLSLTGDCTEEPGALDPVLDPGCPDLHPPLAFAKPTSVATDFYGNIYVGNFGKAASGSEGRVDIFDSQGVYITEVSAPAGTVAVQVDSKGTLYVAAKFEGAIDFYRYVPTEYDGSTGKIAYGSPTKFRHSGAFFAAMALNPANDHLFVNLGAGGIVEFASVEEENKELGTIDVGTWPYGVGVAVDADHNRIYATEEDARVGIFTLSEPHEKLGTIEESAIPEGTFLQYISLAADEGTGHLFLLDTSANRIYEFDESGAYVSTLERSFQVVEAAQMGIDNGPFSPNGAGVSSTKGHYLYVPSHKTGTGHSFAFFESSEGPPRVEDLSSANPTESEVELRGMVDANGVETTYTFEYTTLADFEANGFANATVVEGGQLPAANGFRAVSQAIGGLESATKYRFRMVATNTLGSDEAEGSFGTYPAPPIDDQGCPNQPLRIGMSRNLPDCRAFELVTPADTNGRAPLGASHIGAYFTSRQVSPAGDKVPFRVEGGALPGIGGTGSYDGDPFLATRAADGWHTTHTGPDGTETVGPIPGGSSPDQGYSFWTAQGEGSKVIEGKFTVYLRYPDGHSELVGEGSSATEPEVIGRLISENGSHTIFDTSATSSETQLEPDAAPDGTKAVYDRALDGDLRVISLLPGNVPLKAGEDAEYTGSSLDGDGVAFSVDNTLYLRYQNTETYEIGTGVAFAGVANGGSRVFYLDGGQLLRRDVVSGEVTPFSTGAVTPVNVAPDGQAAYFISTEVLTTVKNPRGAKAKLGKQNLYLSEEGAISFVGTITDRDVEGTLGNTEQVDGLGLWVSAVEPPTPGRLAVDPSRTTADGRVIIFQSRAPLTGFDPDEHPQIYRFDSVNDELDCLSCNPSQDSASGDATLQSYTRGSAALFEPTTWIENLNADGDRAIFQSTEALVPEDNDGLQDVYEWEDEGVGSCTLTEGCVYLISSGHSIRDDYLWAVDPTGDNVFFLTSDLLLPSDADETVSIYDARVNGGFTPPSPPSDCQGEGCRPQITSPPALPGPNTPAAGTDDNFKPGRHCRKGQRKVKRHGKVRCVKKHHRKAATKRKGANK